MVAAESSQLMLFIGEDVLFVGQRYAIFWTECAIFWTGVCYLVDSVGLR